MKNLYLIIISILCLTCLTGCTESKELHEHAYVIAIGVDKSKENLDHIRVTFEFVIPIAFDAESTSKVSTYTTIEATTLHSAISLANTYISKELNLSHNKVIVFSEELAYEGLEKYVSTIANDKNYRTNMYLAVSKCSAEEYIKNTKPQLEKNPAKFYELLFQGYNYTSMLPNSYFLGYVLSTQSTHSNPIAILTNISQQQDDTSDHQTQADESIGPYDSQITAGQIPKTGATATDTLGMIAFKNGYAVGELTGEDTIYYQMVRNTFEEVYYSIYDPFIPQNIIAFNLSKKDNSKIKVEFVNDKPLILLDVNIQANIISISNNSADYQNRENLEVIRKQLEYVIHTNIESFLYKTSKQFGSDICAFGRMAAKNYLTIHEWNESNWLEMYKYSYFKVNVNVDMEKSGLIFLD